MTIGRLATALAVSLALFGTPPTHAQAPGGRTPQLVQQLSALLDTAKLDSIAARMEGTEDEFVAALYFPGAQLLVVSATYSVPALLNEKILLRNYRDVYIDLHSATDPETRVLVEDMRADGIRPTRAGENEPFDIYTKGLGANRFPFDGAWRSRKTSEEDYMKAFADADVQYARMLASLIAELERNAASQ